MKNKNHHIFLKCNGFAFIGYAFVGHERRRQKVSHLADKKMKSLLNMAALSAKKNDKEIGDYYKRKVAEGKHKMLVQNNIRCKVLSRIFAVVTRESAWVNTQKFAA